MGRRMDRRRFLAAAPLAAAAAPAADLTCKPMEEVRIGFIGVGNRGSAIVRQLLRVNGCRIVAVCDLIPERVTATQRAVEKAGHPTPARYDRGETDYLRLCDRGDLDLVITATSWKWHAPMCVAALQAGKHAATEQPAALTVEECWQMVEAAEKAGKHCIQLENYCYFREVMCVLNMVRKGLFGEPLHVYTGYQKEAMYYSFNKDGTLTFAGEGQFHQYGNVYPAHFTGPSAQWLDINRGDSFDYLVSMPNLPRAFNLYARKMFGPDNPYAKASLPMTDISNTLIRTKKGRSLHLIHDTLLPRPYRHYYTLMATNGIYEHNDKRIHIDGRSPGEWTFQDRKTAARQWEPLANYYPEFEHPLWRQLGTKATTSGHGGGDYMMAYRLIESFRKGTYPDIDVYDTVAWNCIVELSDRSARNRSCPVDFPDFTRGRWKTRAPLPIPEGSV